VEAVLFGSEGIAATDCAGTLVVDHSSIAPASARAFAERLRERGAELLDAPVSGGRAGAEAGSLSMLIGGKASALRRARPYLRLMGKRITRIGESGAGQLAKLVNQIIVALTIAAHRDAFDFAARAGLDGEAVRKALRGGMADGRVLSDFAPLMVRGAFDSDGRNARILAKDLANALAEAERMGLHLPGVTAAAARYREAAR
jgi:2-hydroxy-3-oxopropionate reductase